MRPSERDTPQTTVVNGRTFDAAPSRDDRSLDFPIRPLLAEYVRPVRTLWRRGPILDQGQDGACVGHGWAAELAATPDRVNFANVTFPTGTGIEAEPVPADAHTSAFWIYHRAKQVDEYAGEDYDGTSVNAGAKVARELGVITGWRWATSKADMRDTLISKGPLVIAIPWLDGMWETSPGGELTITGSEVGWHCLLVNGYDPSYSVDAGTAKKEMVRLQQSWGTSWGDYGSCWTSFEALWSHIEGNSGDVCVPQGRSLT